MQSNGAAYFASDIWKACRFRYAILAISQTTDESIHDRRLGCRTLSLAGPQRQGNK
jgi:hypothetical protein